MGSTAISKYLTLLKKVDLVAGRKYGRETRTKCSTFKGN